MRQGSNNGRRPRGRTNRKQHGGGPSRPHTFDSNGPDGRVRGNARQVYEKYLTLARDAQSSGDRIAAEAYFQHAEHYFRIMSDSTDPQRPDRRQEERQPAPAAEVDVQGETTPVVHVNGDAGGPGRAAKAEGEATEEQGNGHDAEATVEEAPADRSRSQDGPARPTVAKRRGRPRKPRSSEPTSGEGEDNSSGETAATSPTSSESVTSES